MVEREHTARSRGGRVCLRLMLSLFIGFVISSVDAQPYWAKDLSGLGNNHIADVQVDADGSIYVTGEYGGTAQLDGQSLVTSGSIDLFVARMDPDGTVLWLKRGGGPGIDRGVKLALGGTTVAITGEFLGTATFEGETITSAGGTSDMYVAVLDKDDGAMQWLRQGGGAAGTDRPSGISMAADGSLCVTGEFRGSATWGTITEVSQTDPTTGTPSTDVFITRYSAAGDVLWVRTGSAKFADRGVDVVHSAAGGIYVTGQFSDTIAFQQVHPNALLNATFLVHFDASGDEQWFRRAGGAGFNHVRDLVMAPDGNLLMVGDVQGTMVYFGPPQVSVPGGDPYAYYLLEVSGTGQLIAQRTAGSTSGLTARGLALAGNDIAVLGEFTCQFTDLRDLYGGSGLFMAVGPQDLFVSRHTRSGLVLNEAQQFGGRSAKSAGGIAFVGAGQLVFTGSFQQNLIFPATAGFDAELGTGGSGVLGNGVALYCDDPDYGTFAALTATALLDGFVARGYVEGREPYDWWLRTGSACERDTLDICIRRGAAGVCEDTIRSCGPTGLNVLTDLSHTAGSGTNYLGPPLTYAWSNGSAAPNITVSSSGTYWVTVTSENGCYLWRDTIQVIVVPVPPLPLVSDDVVLNTATSNPQLIELCDPETHWVWSTNVPAGNEHYWVLPDGTEVTGDSVQVDTTGNYTFVVVNDQGCQRQTVVPVLDSASPELPDLGLDLVISFPDDTDLNDSLFLCPTDPIAYDFVPQWTLDGEPVEELPPGLELTWGLSLPPSTPFNGGLGGGTLPPLGPGWYVVDLWVRVTNRPCGEDSILFNAVDSIHVQFHPSRDVTVQLLGPLALCDGEPVVLSATCTGCDTLIWSPGNVQLIAPDSILVSVQGVYQVVAQTMDENGCTFSAQASVIMNIPTGPTLQVDPTDGIICPGGEATLSTTTIGVGHVWYGPEGPIEGEGGDLTTTVPGEYYLTMVVDGCSVTSNNVELFSYGTPFLDVQPFGVLCHPDDEVVIQVLAAPGAAVQWSSPLIGTGLQQVIDEAGSYSCTVTSCGITTPLSVEIISAPVEATLLTSGPFTVCSGDSVALEGELAGSEQYWLPGDVPGTQITVNSSGNYTYVVANEEGCRDTTAVVVVDVVDLPEPLAISGDTVCAGALVTLTAQGSGTPVWYADPSLTQVLGTGSPYQFTASVTTTLHAVQERSGCVGDTVTVLIVVRPLPSPITIDGPHAVCQGEPLTLRAAAPDSVILLWSTPTGPMEGATVFVPAATLADQGFYTCTPSVNGCTGAPASMMVLVNVPVPITLPEISVICEGALVELSVPDGFSQAQWSTGSSELVISVIASDTITVTGTDATGCQSTASTIIVVEPCDLVIPNVITPNADGTNDDWRLSGGFVRADAWIYNRWGTLVHEGDLAVRHWDGTHQRSGQDCPDGVYYYVLQMMRADMQMNKLTGYIQLLR